MAFLPWLVKNIRKNHSYPCEPSTIEEIHSTLLGAAQKETDSIFRLKQTTCQITAEQIPWVNLRYLGFLGDADRDCNSALEEAGLKPGIYINRDGTALVQINQSEEYIQSWADRCGSRLQILAVYHAAIPELDVSRLVNLQEICLYQNYLLSSLTGLQKLSQLSSLYLIGFDHLAELPGLEKLTQLTDLHLTYCRKLVNLPGLENLTQLTYLDLSCCWNLVCLPSLENLTQLTYLNLSMCDKLTALPGLEKLTQLTYLNLFCCDNLASLPDLENLTQLTKLSLPGCQSLTVLPGLEKLTQLTKLYLSNCKNLTSLPGLENLTQLASLDLHGCEKLTALPGLENLTQLTRLDLSGCEKLTALPGLENLTQLSSLNLSKCQNLTALSGLEKLTQLASLNLCGCEKLTALPGLGNLTQLSSLYLSRCQSLTALSGLEKLTQLASLDLSGCEKLTALPRLEKLTQLSSLNLSECQNLTALSGLKSLTQLTSLDLSGCEKLTALPGLEKLVQLADLKISRCGKLTALPDLGKLVHLTNLDLSDCSQLTTLPSLEKLVWLTELNLSGCSQLTALPEGIRQIKGLKKLKLQRMQLQDLPDWLPEIADRFSVDIFGWMEFDWDHYSRKMVVYLQDTAVEGVDMSIFEQSYEVVREWFEKRKLGQTHPLNEIKVVFLGDGEAGKSHTIARLMNDGGEPVDYTDQSTPGIVIKHRYYTVDERRFRVNYWDFGGQEIMHSMHRIFLTGRTMYVILLNARDDTQCDRAKYWLHNVKSFAPEAPVLLVLNKIDQNENASVDERDLRGRYDKLTQVVKLSAKDFTPEQFNDSFTKILLDEIQKTGFLDAQWPTAWIKVKEKLENMESHYIMGSDYQALCRECRVNDNQKSLLHWFNDLGISFCCDGEDDYTLEDYVILRPDWITNALYIILFNPLEGARNGLIPHRSIYTLLKNAQNNPAIRCTLPQAKYTSGDIDYVLRIMRKFNLSFTDGHENEFIPMLCQQNSMVDVQYYHKDAEILEFNMAFDYLPNNLLHRLMVERCSELDMTAVWRTGARFNCEELGYSAVVVIDGNILRFFIRHDDPMHRPNTYLTMLKAHVDRIVEKMDLKAPICKLIYKLDGSRDVFDFEMLKLRLEVGQTHELAASHRKMIPIADILNQSAPDGLEDEKKLLNAIRKSCLNIQAEPDYYLNGNETGRGMEDKRNRRIRDDLQMLGYDVKDQTQRGLSGTGRGIGELDLLLLNDKKEPWTIIEALRVSNGTKTEWDKHLNKLVKNYNYFGAPCVYLLTYVDADITNFQRIWSGYKDHIPNHNPGKFTYCDDSLVVQNDVDGLQYVKTATCRYDRGGQVTTAYHIFVRIPKQNEIIP